MTITAKSVLKLQADYGVGDKGFSEAEVTFEEYLSQCRIYISENLPKEYSNSDWDSEKKTNEIKHLASDFIDKHPVKVKNYISKSGVKMTDLLLEDVIDGVTGVSILKEALDDPEVDEIQINDMYTIYVQKNGRLQYYEDKRGRVMQFVSNEEIHIVLNKLIDDGLGNIPQFTGGNPIMNAKTAKDQYRINAVHHEANAQDKPPHAFPITSVVIRKFKENQLVIEDLIKYEALTPKMGRFTKLLGHADLNVFCVGPTGSGKTTLLGVIAEVVNRRMILVQNPTELSFKERDEFGRNKKNVVHWEVITAAKLEELTSNTLRHTPEVIVMGEGREAPEFYQIQRAMRGGHPVFGTYHASSAEDAVGRFADELGASDSSTYFERVRMVAKNINIVISQYRFADGKRRVMEIAEILGVREDGEPKVNQLFKFQLNGKVVINEFGLPESQGEFKQVGTLSESIKEQFYKAGISQDTLEEFCTLDGDGKA